MMDNSDNGSAYYTNNDEISAKRLRLAVMDMEPSRQFYDKNDFNNSDTKFLWDRRGEDGKSNVQAFYGRIREFFVNDKFTDVNIICENQIFGCHRLILAATCEYFETMFSENFRENDAEEITLHDVSIVTFKEILTFAYKGCIQIDDNNVSELLCAGNLFGLTFIESECTRYLLEENIPTKEALAIFIFACNLRKTTLIPVVGQFILEHLDHLSRTTAYLEILFDDLCLLLANFRSLSLHDDRVILSAISQWVFHSGRKTEDKKILFNGLLKKVQRWYQRFSVEDSYYSFLNCELIDNAAVDSPLASDVNHARSFHQLPIHVYVNIISRALDSSGKPEYNQSHIFTSNFEKDDNNIDWYHSFSMETNIDEMRTVVIGSQLYYFRRDALNGRPTFSVSSSANLSLNKLSLKLPPDYSSNNLLCCDKKTCGIYSFNSSKYLFLYNRELDEWTSILLSHETSRIGNCMTCHDDGRLYLFTGISGNRFVRAYDHRDGKWSALTKYTKSSATIDECCSFKGKIYVSCYSKRKQNEMEIFDQRSEKWLNSIELSFEGHHEGKKDITHRLLPHCNLLWMFSSVPSFDSHRTEINCIYVKSYNSFQQKCTLWPALDEAIFYKLQSSCHHKSYLYEYPDSYHATITDVVTFNPLE